MQKKLHFIFLFFATSRQHNYGHTDNTQLIIGGGKIPDLSLVRATGALQVGWKTSPYEISPRPGLEPMQ